MMAEGWSVEARPGKGRTHPSAHKKNHVDTLGRQGLWPVHASSGRTRISANPAAGRTLPTPTPASPPARNNPHLAPHVARSLEPLLLSKPPHRPTEPNPASAPALAPTAWRTQSPRPDPDARPPAPRHAAPQPEPTHPPAWPSAHSTVAGVAWGGTARRRQAWHSMTLTTSARCASAVFGKVADKRGCRGLSLSPAQMPQLRWAQAPARLTASPATPACPALTEPLPQPPSHTEPSHTAPGTCPSLS